MTTWLALGSSLTAASNYLRAKKFADIIATANQGLEMEPHPDWYWLTDSIAAKRDFAKAKIAVKRGAKMITSKLALRYSPFLEEIAHKIVEYEGSKSQTWVPGTLVNGRTSGCFLIQIAVNEGADKVLMVGLEGYKSKRGDIKVDYFHGGKGVHSHSETMKSYGPMVQSVIDQSPNVEFHFFGTPNYPWKGLRLVKDMPLVVSYFTQGTIYVKEIEHLRKSLHKYVMDYEFRGMPNTGNWRHNCAMKGPFMRDMMAKLDRPLIWLDADARVIKYPILFEQLKCDFACMISWHREKPGSASGTMYFNNTDATKKLLDVWADMCKKEPDELDQHLLHRALKKVDLNFTELPHGYCIRELDKVRDGDSPDRFIHHFQASRRVDKQAVA